MADPMEVEANRVNVLPERWQSIQYILTRGSPLAHPDFEPSEEVSSIKAYVLYFTIF